jgi:PAS domain S-box-containing protein
VRIALHLAGFGATIHWANQEELGHPWLKPAEYIGQNISQFQVDASALEHILNRLSSGKKLRQHQARLRAKEGAIRYVIIDSSVLFENGRFMHARCFSRDITDRRIAENAL